MTDALRSLNGIQLDTLKELGSVGSGNAVSSLAKMLNKKVEMFVPVVNICEFKDISNFIGGGEQLIAGVLVNISGDINGMMMFIIREESAHTLLKILFHQDDDAQEDFSEIQLSALQEVGNILASSYLGSLASMIHKKIMPSVPYLSIDMANAILSVPAIEFGKISDRVLFIESVFKAAGEDVSGYFILVPDLPSFQLILSSLGVK